MDIDEIHFLKWKSDSMHYAVGDNLDEPIDYAFKCIITYKSYFEANNKYFFSTSYDLFEQKKLIGLTVGKMEK